MIHNDRGRQTLQKRQIGGKSGLSKGVMPFSSCKEIEIHSRQTLRQADTSGGSKGGAASPTAQNVLNFMQFFSKLDKIIC